VTYHLGVDLGTTFTAAAVVRDGRASSVGLGIKRTEIPSVVLVREDGTVLTGEAAERRATTEPGRVGREFKRRLGDTTPLLLGGASYSAETLMARLLRSVVDDVVQREGGQPAGIAVSHPANWGPYKTDLLRQALQLADLDGAVLVTEPEAAAISYAHGQRLTPGQAIAVYDLGGGTFDAAVLRATDDGFELLGTPVGIERLGGIDFDAAVLGHVVAVLGDDLAELDEDDPNVEIAMGRLRQECIDAREALSSDTEVDIPVVLPGLSTTIRLTRGELEQMIRPALGDTVAALRRVVDGAGIAAEDLHAVLLVGGASRTPLVASLVSAELGLPVVVDADPKHAVATGAAYAAAAADDAAAVAAADGAAGATPAVPASDSAADVTAAAPAAAGPAASSAAAGTPAAATPTGGAGRSRPVGLLVGAGVLVLALVAGAVTLLGGDDTTPQTATGQPDPGAGSTGAGGDDLAFVRTTVDEGSMVLVDVTDPTIGTDTPAVLDPPEFVATRQLAGRTVAYVDLRVATNRQFYDFVSFTSALPGRDPAGTWTELAPGGWQTISAGVPETFDALGLPAGEPVLGASWEAADGYCTYALKRLVSEVEWELAARDGLIDASEHQDWVADPEAYGPVPDGARVLRGSFGIEDLPVTQRTIGDSPVNRRDASVRCAADDIVAVPAPTGERLYAREFSTADIVFDWPDFHDGDVPEMAFGYHAPDVFHIEVRDERRLAVLAGNPVSGPVSVQVDTELRLPDPLDGAYEYGMVSNADASGYTTFTVRPESTSDGLVLSWCAGVSDTALVPSGPRYSVTTPPGACAEQGELPIEDLRVQLRVEHGADAATFLVDGVEVGSAAVPLAAEGDFGFVVDSLQSSIIVHAHYDNLVAATL
jgi:actin-like ATPase involved in cell morphogenesis